MKIHALLDRDPLRTPLANSGQARLTSGEDAKVVAELRAELETFVCEGQFADALQRILERYNANLDRSRQDSVWVSGFFGSGKSHLLKMLAHLWANTTFADGATARGLVSRLPSGVEAALRELDVNATRTGAPVVAAAGSLLGGNVDHVRLAVLSVLLRACGWPSQYPQARFCFWLREEGLLDRVRGAVEAAGRTWAGELNNLYVSPVLAKEILAAKPDFAADVRAARQLLANQFPPPRTDIATEEFVAAAKQALTPDGELPLTILVLDEVQQYVHEAQDRSAAITELAEALQTQFSSRVLLVAAGQSALSAGIPALQWLSDRFRIAVQLSDAEVEVVTRHVLLLKKASALPAIREMLESNAGEVSRHLQGSKLAVRPEDDRYGAEDYPLLRTRRRFWEACFQAADQPGTQSQLRSQLRILYDSLRDIADRDLGAVIPASDLYRALAPDLVNSGVLPNEIHTRIAKLAEGDTPEGALRRDLCGIAFLIGKLPREGAADLGVRADASTLADLLVDDVSADSGPFRNRVSETLEAMASEGVLLKVAQEYRLQTRAGADWELALRRRRTALTRQEVDIARLREQLLGGAVQDVVSGIRVRHGEAKLPRKLALHAGAEPETGGGDAIRIWLRDEWSCSWAEAQSEARRRGMDDAVLHVHLRKRSADKLQSHIVEAEAARQVLDERGVPDSGEGREARESMKSRLAAAEDARDRIVRDIIRDARVLQGGGGELHGEDLRIRLQAGVEASLARLYPRFPEADHRSWGVALNRARQGGDQPFGVVGWNEAVSRHVVAREVLDAVGTGNRGGTVRKRLTAAPYGWPQDAVDAALVALHGADHLKAVHNGRPLGTGQLDQKTINTTDFRPEKVRLTVAQRTKIRGLYRRGGVSAKSGEEGARAAEFLAALGKLASEAGGDAPLPPAPRPAWLDDLGRLTGNEQLLAIFNEKDKIVKAVSEWSDLAERASERLPLWELATALHGHATGELDIAEQVGEQLDAILSQRSLLEEADHVSPCVAKLSARLRAALTEQREDLTQAVVAETERLDRDATWTQLEGDARDEIRLNAGLAVPDALPRDTNEALRRALDARRLSAWRSDIDAVPARAAKALAEAARRVSPDQRVTSVTLRRGTLQDETAVRGWLNEHERKLTEAVRNGPVIVQ